MAVAVAVAVPLGHGLWVPLATAVLEQAPHQALQLSWPEPVTRLETLRSVLALQLLQALTH